MNPDVPPQNNGEFKGRTGARLDSLERQATDMCARLGSVERIATINNSQIKSLEVDMSDVQDCARTIEHNVSGLREDMTKRVGSVTAQVSEMKGMVRTWGIVLSILIALFGFLVSYSAFLHDHGTASAGATPPAVTAPAGR